MQAQFLPLRLELNLQPLVLELHVVKALDCLVGSARVGILKEAESAVVTWHRWILLQTKPLELPKRLTELSDVILRHIVWNPTHEDLLVSAIKSRAAIASRKPRASSDSILEVLGRPVEHLLHRVDAKVDVLVPELDEPSDSKNPHVDSDLRIELSNIVHHQHDLGVLFFTELKGHDAEAVESAHVGDRVLLGVRLLGRASNDGVEEGFDFILGDFQRDVCYNQQLLVVREVLEGDWPGLEH